MIGSLNSFTQNNNVSFNSMYGVGKDWNVKFPIEKEKEVLSNLLSELHKNNVKYINNDGVIFNFQKLSDDVSFTKEKEHMMANIKCVSRADEDLGYYIINDSSDPGVKSFFAAVSEAFSKLIGKHKSTTSILRDNSGKNSLMINFKNK